MPDLQSQQREIQSLRLASWLLLNNQKLQLRELQPDGKIKYIFEKSTEIEHLVEIWNAKSAAEVRLVRFSAIVSYEIRRAVRMRRERGMPLRLNSVFDSTSGTTIKPPRTA